MRYVSVEVEMMSVTPHRITKSNVKPKTKRAASLLKKRTGKTVLMTKRKGGAFKVKGKTGDWSIRSYKQDRRRQAKVNRDKKDYKSHQQDAKHE